jgi:hypothetical protein
MSRILLMPLNALLHNNGKQKSVDEKGNVTYVEAPIFTETVLLEYLRHADQSVKSVLKIDNTINHGDLVVEYAYYLALMSKSLVERGREYAIQDNGVYMNPPNVSSHMMDVAANVISNWFRKVELIRG